MLVLSAVLGEDSAHLSRYQHPLLLALTNRELLVPGNHVLPIELRFVELLALLDFRLLLLAELEYGVLRIQGCCHAL